MSDDRPELEQPDERTDIWKRDGDDPKPTDPRTTRRGGGGGYWGGHGGGTDQSTDEAGYEDRHGD